MTITSTAPEWLQVGADVVLYSVGGFGSENVKRTRVKRVAGQSFTVDDDREPRFRIDTLVARVGTGFSAYLRHVVPLDSDTARVKLRAARIRTLIGQADGATEAWRRDRSPENRQELARLLQLIDEAERAAP